MAEKVITGMSGGVDSSVAAKILLNNGYNVTGVTLQLYGDLNDCEDAKAVSEKLNIPHLSVDFKDKFKELVIEYFINEYIAGNTPNPCNMCNKTIKFGAMLDWAAANGFDKIATGHYARIERSPNGRYLLKKAADLSKDQSYVLYCLTQNQLAHTLFPLGDKTKAEVRQIAAENGFINANRPDSQDICFVPDGDYAAFIEEYTGKITEAGNYINEKGEILGKHKGVICYTIGQRKGLGIALGKPQFVISKNAETGEVVLGDEESLFYRKVFVKELNFIPFDKLEGKMRIKAKLRYRHTEQPAVIYPYEDGIMVEFDSPQRAPSSGQAAVFYDGDIVVGGGIIVKGVEK